jgi:hypothetical protein
VLLNGMRTDVLVDLIRARGGAAGPDRPAEAAAQPPPEGKGGLKQ